MTYSNYSLDYINENNPNYAKICEMFLALATDASTREKLKCILYEGGYNGYSVSSKHSNRDNPYIEISRRISMAYLALRNPDTFDYFVENNINLFHGTNFSALPGIIKYGLNSVDESLKNGIEVNSGEEWSRINGGRNFVSLTDVLDIAENYSTIGSKNEQSFVLIGTNVDLASSIGFHRVHSDIPEVAVKSNLPLECIRVICVPSDKIDYVKRIVGDKPIKILAVDGINDKFYNIDDMYFITIFEEKYNEFKQGLSKKRKKFNIGEIKTMVEKFTISKFKDLLNKFRDLLSGGKKLDYGRRSTK